MFCSDHLKIHMKTHDNQKPFQCTVCNRGYNTAAALTSHMQNHKKQQHLMGANRTYNYSPRSNCSTSSTGSLKRKYSSFLTDTNNNSNNTNTTNHVNGPSSAAQLSPSRHAAASAQSSQSPLDSYRFMSLATANKVCIYCTKSDFSSTEQLYNHIQTKHYGLLVFPNSSPPTAAGYPTVKSKYLECEFCANLKFPTAQHLYHHLQTSHAGQFAAKRKSPPALIEEKLSLQNAKTEIEDHLDAREQPDLNNNSNNEKFQATIKTESKESGAEDGEEDQESPTDLSQPKRTKPDRGPSKEDNKEMKFLCNQCNAGLPDFETFRLHLKGHLAPQETEQYACTQCPLGFPTKRQLEGHTASHFLVEDVEYGCPVASCKKKFSKSEDIQKHHFDYHMQIFYKCTICGESFDNKVALQVHFAVGHHKELKVLRCTNCIEVFHNAEEFQHHVINRHVVRGGIQCLFCPALCHSELEMHFHLAAHTRQYQ